MDLWLPRHAQKERQFARNDGMLTQMCLRQILNVVRFAKGDSAAESLSVFVRRRCDERHVFSTPPHGRTKSDQWKYTRHIPLLGVDVHWSLAAGDLGRLSLLIQHDSTTSVASKADFTKDDVISDNKTHLMSMAWMMNCWFAWFIITS